MKRKRGRPRAESQGAREALQRVAEYAEAHGLSASTLALRVGMNPSSVTRTLSQDPPRWTPSLKKICGAINQINAPITTEAIPSETLMRLARLLRAPKPTADAVVAILEEVQRLVESVTTSASSAQKRLSPRRRRTRTTNG